MIVFFSCKQINEEEKIVNLAADFISVDEKGVRLDSTTIHIDEFTFTVFSNYIYNKNQERPIFFNQMVILKKNNRELYSSKHDGGYDSVKTNIGYLKFMQNFISKIGVMKVENKNYFIVEGWGGCNYCSTYSIIINERGKLEYKLFWTEKNQKIFSHFGNLNMIFKDTNDLIKYQKGEYNINAIPCFNCTPSTVKNLFNDPYN